MITLSPLPKFREMDDTGQPLVGGMLYTAQPGTVAGPGQSFPKPTYTDSTGATSNSNPVYLDASGRADVWLDGLYSMALYAADGTLVYSADNVGLSTSVMFSGASTVMQVFADASDAIYNAEILAANDDNAPMYYEIFKIDDSANAVSISPSSGTVAGLSELQLTTKGECAKLTKNANENNWYQV